MKICGPRPNKAPSGSPALSRSTGLNASQNSVSSLEIAAFLAPLFPLLLIHLTIGEDGWMSAAVEVLIRVVIAAGSLIHGLFPRARPERRSILFVFLAVLLVFCSTQDSRTLEWSASSFSATPDAPSPHRFDFFADLVPQPSPRQPSPRMLYGGEAEEATGGNLIKCSASRRPPVGQVPPQIRKSVEAQFYNCFEAQGCPTAGPDQP